MRIRLVDKKGKRNGRRGRGSRRSRQRRAFDTAIAMPQIDGGRASGERRTAKEQSVPDSRWGRKNSPASTIPAPRLRIGWRVLGLRVLAALLLVGLLAAIIYGSTASKFFVYEAEILGSNHVKPELIYQAAGVHEQNIFWIRPETVGERIIQLDGIKTVRVRCRLPAAVRIQVEEREPTTLWHAKSQGRDWWLDEDGVVLPYPGVVGDAVFVVDKSARQLQLGGRIEPEGVVRSVEQLAASLPEVQVFFYEDDLGLSFTQRTALGEWPVYVGNSTDLQRKIQVLQALNGHLRTNKIRPRYVDVRWADYPVYGKQAKGD